jgi:hypothetical protein
LSFKRGHIISYHSWHEWSLSESTRVTCIFFMEEIWNLMCEMFSAWSICSSLFLVQFVGHLYWGINLPTSLILIRWFLSCTFLKGFPKSTKAEVKSWLLWMKLHLIYGTLDQIPPFSPNLWG